MTRDPRSSWLTSSIEFLFAGLYLTQPGTSIIGDPIDKVTGGVWGIEKFILGNGIALIPI